MKADNSPPMQIKAEREGFLLVPDPAAPFQTMLEYVEHRLTESHAFFFRARMILDLRERPFRADEVLALRRLLEEKAEVKLAEVRVGESPDFVYAWVSQHLGVTVRESKEGAQRDRRPYPVIVRNTCRSGARIESPADCIVLGDVNPGAEVLAAGDIVIFGSLRGMAHAGIFGDRSARIWALSIEPNQIRIADLVAVPPRGGKPVPKRFEVAEVIGDRIEVVMA